MRRSRKRNDRGAAAVEFALVVPFVALLLVGMVTTGFTYSDHLSITNAVREGARFGASAPYDQTTPSVITPAEWAASVQTRVHDVYFNSGSTINANNVCVQLVPQTGSALVSVGSNCGTAPANPDGMATGSCVVKVWTRKPANITLVIAPTLNFNIGASSVSFYGRKAGLCTAE
jgi:Flp pilus assembly protein TadG